MELSAFRSLVESASDIIYRIDRCGRIAYANAAVADVLGYARDEVVGRRVEEFVAPGSGSSLEAAHARVIRSRTDSIYEEVPVLARDGRIVWLGQHVHFQYDAGRLIAFSAIARDISEHRRLAELQLGQKSLLELIARGKALIDVLDTLAWFLEAQIPDCAVALLVLGSDGHLMQPLVAPGLSDEEVQEMEEAWEAGPPLPKAVDVPPSERVVCTPASELWEGGRFAICRTIPVLTKDRHPNGVVALMQYEDVELSADDYRLLEVAAQIAGIAIERDRIEITSRMELKRQVAERTVELERSNRLLRYEIAERKDAERALLQSESLLKEAERIAHLGSWSWIPGDDRQLWSDEAYRIFGVEKADFSPTLRNLVRMLHPDDRRRIRDLLVACIAGEAGTGEFRIIRPDGDERTVELECSYRKEDHPGRVIGVMHDITEQRVLEKELLKAGERERKRVGRDLHDGLGQLLTGIGFLSKTLTQTLEETGGPEAVDAAEITHLVENAIDHTRSLSKLLLPVELEENGLEAALQRLRSHVEGVYGLSCLLKTSEYLPIPDPEIALHMYRVAQEAVNNAVRHGKPGSIEVTLSTIDGKTILQIADDGIGVPEGIEQQSTGLGLRTMQFRAQTIGATLTIARREPRGTVVTCELPNQIENQPVVLLQPS